MNRIFLTFAERQNGSFRTNLLGAARLSAAVLLFGFAATAWGQSSTESRPYWGAETGGGFLTGISSIANAAQDKFKVNASGPLFDIGLARMHANGSPSYSFEFTRLSFSGNATGLSDLFAGNTYHGSASLPGFMATKYFSFITRSHFSAGVGLGAGVGPQLSANYSVTFPDGTVLSRKYTLNQLSATPLFAVTFRGEYLAPKHFSIGPYAGIVDGLPVIGAKLRVGFTR